MTRKTLIAIALGLGLLMLPTLAEAQSARTRVWNDASRLAALLHDSQTNVNISPAVWNTLSVEANMLVNRIYTATSGNTTARRAATNLRTHVRRFRQSITDGNASEAQRHGAAALPYALELVEWGVPE